MAASPRDGAPWSGDGRGVPRRRWPPATRSTSRAIVLGSPMLGDEVLTEVRVQVALSRVNRHGLIAGATGTGKTKTLQTPRRPAVGARRAGVRRRRQGRPVGHRRARRRDGPAHHRPLRRRSAWTFEAAGHPLEILSLSGKQRCPRAGERVVVRAAAAGQGARPQRDPDLDPVARSSATATTSSCRCSISRTCGRPSSSWVRTRARPCSRTSAASARPRWA